MTTARAKSAPKKTTKSDAPVAAAETLAKKLVGKLEANKLPRHKRSKKGEPEIILDPVEAAKAAGLRYTSDTQPGYHRVGKPQPYGKPQTFRYTDQQGKPLKDAEALRRIRTLVIPPAWTDVWITPYENGHLQCTGRDARGRKQSRYHPHWREVRDETKYNRMTLFAAALPTIREHLDHDLKLPGMPRNKVLATIVALMQQTLIRVGNEEYAKENHSYGLTTMRNKHVDVHGADIRFQFKGKSGVEHSISLHDRRLARIVRQCEEIPGYELFQWIDKEGEHHALHSDDVNGYLQEITGEHFTAKDFRTWAGSVLACMLLSQYEPFSSEAQAKKNVLEAVKAVASKLGNTPSVCRKCYIHPAVLTDYMDAEKASTRRKIQQQIEAQGASLLTEEQAFLDLLAGQTSLG